MWRRKFIGLLPEVERRRLYEKKGFNSIFEFAAKLAGLSADQVRLALNLERRFADKPILKKMFENGEASINKLNRIVSIATAENEEELAAQIKVLPKSALDTLVRDKKQARAALENLERNSLQMPFFGGKGLPGQTRIKSALPSAAAGCGNPRNLKFELDDDIKEDLNDLHSKGIDVNRFLREMLKRRRAEIAEKKAKISENISQTASRHIPVEVKKILREEHGEKCSIPICRKPSKIIHHTQRFALSQNHDPKFMAPLCREHHAIAHSIDVKYHEHSFALG